MKTSHDPRHLKRIRIMQGLFAWEFRPDKKPKTKDLEQIIKHLLRIDKEIGKAAPAWPIKKINKIDLAILRLAIFELIIMEDTPFKVVIDEAVELSKEFGTESSPGFINGALGNVVDTHKLEQIV